MELQKTKIPRGYRGILVMKEDHISCWIVMSLVFLNILYHTREEKSTYMTGL